MKKTKTLKFHYMFITFLILSTTGVISGVMLVLLKKISLSHYFERSPGFGLFMMIVASVIIGTVISLLVSKKLLQPLNEMIAATQAVSKGDFKVRVTNVPNNLELEALVTNFNQMVAELNNVEMVHNDFINNFSHEFKTPIMSIQGFAEQLQKGDLTEAERQEFIKIIVSESKRLTHLSSNILLLSNLENQGPIRLKKTKYSLSEQLRNCLVILQEEWERKELQLVLDIDEVEFFGDQEMMMSLWLNLLNNGIKFSQAQGELKIACYQLGNQIKVRISDQGIGMSDDVRQNIFAKFYQGDPTRQEKGSGLGLAIAKQIVDLHQGSIHVKSAINQGTAFTIIFDGGNSLLRPTVSV